MIFIQLGGIPKPYERYSGEGGGGLPNVHITKTLFSKKFTMGDEGRKYTKKLSTYGLWMTPFCGKQLSNCKFVHDKNSK